MADGPAGTPPAAQQRPIGDGAAPFLLAVQQILQQRGQAEAPPDAALPPAQVLPVRLLPPSLLVDGDAAGARQALPRRAWRPLATGGRTVLSERDGRVKGGTLKAAADSRLMHRLSLFGVCFCSPKSFLGATSLV